MSEKEVSCMIRRVILSPVAGLLLVIAAILGVGYSSAQSTQTRHLVFSHLSGTKDATRRPCAYLRTELRQRRPGEYLRDRRHRRLQSSRLSECLPTGPRTQQHPVGVRGEIRPQRPTALVHLPGRRQSEAWASGWPPCRMAAWWLSASPLRITSPPPERLSVEEQCDHWEFELGRQQLTACPWTAAPGRADHISSRCLIGIPGKR